MAEPMGAIALKYAARGYRVVPLHSVVGVGSEVSCTCKSGAGCPSKGKHPRVKEWEAVATKDAATINGWWQRWPAANIGLATGPGSGVWVLDIDGPDGEMALAALEAEHGALPPTLESTTGRGRHLFFQWDERYQVRNDAGKKIGFHLDVRGDGGQVAVAPSKHVSGAIYAWHKERRPSAMEAAVAPEWLLKLACPVKPAAAAPATDNSQNVIVLPQRDRDNKWAGKALEAEISALAKTNEGGRNNQLFKSARAMAEIVKGGHLNRSEVEAALRSACLSNGLMQDEGETGFEATLESAFDEAKVEARHPPERQPRGRPAQVTPIRQVDPAPMPVRATSAQVAYDDNDTWRQWLMFKSDNEPDPRALTNYIIYFWLEPEVRGLFAYNEFSGRVMLMFRPPWSPEDGEVWAPKPICDNDYTEAQSWLERHALKPDFAGARRAIWAAAEKNRIHPLRDYISALQWDGVARLDTWTRDYLGAKDMPYTKMVGAKFLIGACARLFRPGCKMDNSLILEGPQGLKKSSALEELATLGGERYFLDSTFDIGSKDGYQLMRGKLIIEFAELSDVKKRDNDRVKSFLSSRVDTYRAVWKTEPEDVPRSSVFTGTVNPESGYLTDPTGSRRFWPVAVIKVDLEGLSAAKDQLWAEAMQRFKKGERWWLEGDEDALARVQQHERETEDIWMPRILALLEEGSMHPSVITVGQIASQLDIPTSQQNSVMASRIRGTLMQLGWKHDRRRINGSKNPVSCFVRD